MRFKAILLFVLLFFIQCSTEEDTADYKERMRDFVISISSYAKSIDPDFIVIPQNGIELVTISGTASAQPHEAYLAAIDAHGQEDFLYGYDQDDEATPVNNTEYWASYLDVSKSTGNTILIIDYCASPLKVKDSYKRNYDKGYISFAAHRRALDEIPTPAATIHQENNTKINKIGDVKNFLYLINNAAYDTKQEFIKAVQETNYDMLVMDLFFDGNVSFSKSEVDQLRKKANGGSRLVVCYMSIGEAEDYRYYWNSAWKTTKPQWLEKENPKWAGNYKVKYWNEDWQKIIFGNDGSYLKKILDNGYDGVYLDIIDAFEYFE